MPRCKPVMFARSGHVPGHQKAICVKHPIAAPIRIVGAAMQDVRGSGRKIQAVKKTAIGMIKRRRAGPVDGHEILSRRIALIGAEAQPSRFLLDKSALARSNGHPSFEPSTDPKPEIANAPGNSPGPKQERAKIADRAGHPG